MNNPDRFAIVLFVCCLLLVVGVVLSIIGFMEKRQWAVFQGGSLIGTTSACLIFLWVTP